MRSSDFVISTARRGRHQAEVDVHGLEGFGVGAACDVVKEGAERRFNWWRGQNFAAQLGLRKARSQNADGGAFDIALAAGDLAGETDVRLRFQPQLPIEQPR